LFRNTHELYNWHERPLLADAVEKGKNEPTEIFACAPAETGFV
jgi:hypothetical protein